MSKIQLTDSFTLPCGVLIKNRLIKSAMSENMGTIDYLPTAKLNLLYSKWASGGVGICISGNIMVDHTALGEPGNLVFDRRFASTKDQLDKIKSLAKAGGENKTSFWAQLNHPGKQSPKFLSKKPVAPSTISFAPPLDKMFNCPKELSSAEIESLIQSFAYAAKVAKDTGFSGVQIHGAHGYLISQFLSPKHNQRSDEWGGSIENRMRFVMEVYKAIRLEVGDAFPIGIKLNSSDFQKGGFKKEEALIVVKALDELGIDLLEISGGTYEMAAMTGQKNKKMKESTKNREAYFIEFTKEIRSFISCPILLTGGFRSLNGINESLSEDSFDFVGLARSLAIDPQLPNRLLKGEDFIFEVTKRTTGVKLLDKLFPLEIIWYSYQLERIGNALNPKPFVSGLRVVFWSILQNGKLNLKRVRA